MPPVIRNIHGDGGTGLSQPLKAVVAVASVVVALTLGVLAWRFIVWRRNRSPPQTLTSTPPTVVRLPREPEPIHPAGTEKGLNYTHQDPSQKSLPPPAYSPEPMDESHSPVDKPPPALNLDVSCGTAAAQRSPLRSASFNPKTQSISSRISSRLSVDTKKLKLPRLMTVSVLYIPSLSDELPIRLGETIRMIEEYEDEWCLVQRVGRTDERGVIPRFCLTERQEIIPRTGKRGSSGLLQTSTFRK